MPEITEYPLTLPSPSRERDKKTKHLSLKGEG
jgi:hypothetical protein